MRVLYMIGLVILFIIDLFLIYYIIKSFGRWFIDNYKSNEYIKLDFSVDEMVDMIINIKNKLKL